MVSATASSPTLSRTRWAINSRPVASGNVDPVRSLFGSLRAVALAPAHGGVAHDLVLQLHDPVDERLGARRAARHVDIHGEELVGTLDDGVVVEHPGARGARAHRDHPLRLEHLLVQPADDRRHLDRDAAGQDQQVCLSRREPNDLGAEPREVVPRRADDRDHLDRAAREPEAEREQRVLARPVLGLLELGEQEPLLDLLLEVLALELAAQELLRLQLPDAEVVSVDLRARHFHSSAPLLQTNTSAISSSTTKTIVSTSAKTPNASSFIATG